MPILILTFVLAALIGYVFPTLTIFTVCFFAGRAFAQWRRAKC